MARWRTHVSLQLKRTWLLAIVILTILTAATAQCPAGCLCRDDTADCSNGDRTRPPEFGDLSPTIHRLLLDNNSLSELQFEHFEKLFNLQEFSARNNQIRLVNNGTFSAVHKLTALDLSYNRMVEFPAWEVCNQTLIQKISLENNMLNGLLDFSGCFFLSELDLATNSITNLQNLSLPSLFESAVTLDLSGNKINKLSSGDFNVSCVKVLLLGNNGLSEVAIDTWQAKAVATLFELDMTENLLDALAVRNLFYNLRNASRLSQVLLAGNRIEHLESMSVPPVVQVLDLSRNLVQRVSFSFESPSNLVELSLRSNQIEQIGNCSFDNLQSLQYLDLSINRISATRLERKTFASLIQLRTLNLSGNCISEINQGDMFLDVATLNVLDLSWQHPRLYFINETTFLAMTALQALNLRGNAVGIQLKSSFALFKPLQRLSSLLLDDNQISEVARGIFAGSPLTLLSANDNFMRAGHFQSLVTGLQNLQNLAVVNNSIESISEDTIHSLKDLVILDLRNNVFNCDTRLCYFSAWLLTTSVNVVGGQSYRCADGNFVFNHSSSGLCYATASPPPSDPPTLPLAVQILLGAIGLLIIVVVVIVIINKLTHGKRKQVAERQPLLPDSNRIPTGFDS